MIASAASTEQELIQAAKLGQLKIVSSERRPEDEVNELLLLVGPELVRLRWARADRFRQWLCAAYAAGDLPSPLVPRAGIAKAH